MSKSSHHQHLLAISALMSGRHGDGLRCASEAARLAPRDAQIQFTLGRAHKAAGDIAAAVRCYRRAIALRPAFAEAQVSLGIALKDQGDLAAAIACHRRALQIDPSLAVAHANLGNTLALQAERDAAPGKVSPLNADAETAQRRALEADPHNATLHRNLGVTLMRTNRYQEAAHAFNEALSRDASLADCCLQLGHCLRKLAADELARQGYEKWLAHNPPSAAVMSALATVLTEMGETEAAFDWARRAHALAPDAETLQAMASALSQSRRTEEAIGCYRESVELAGRHPAVYPGYLMMLNYVEQDPRQLAMRWAEYGAGLRATDSRRAGPRRRAPGDRLRVGYVSGDFRRHSVTYFVGALLELHDTDRFEVFCYHNCAFEDVVTQRLKAIGHHWIDCAEMSDEELIERIRDDAVDVLIDLSGHTSHARPTLFASAPAAVQIAYLGYPTVSGVPNIDYRITDRVIDPGDQPDIGSETPLCCPRTMFCYRPDAQPEVGDPPALRAGRVTFGSFNNIAKLSDHTLAMWAAVLNAVPRSRLFLKTRSLGQPANRANIRRFMEARGVGGERLLFNPWRPDLVSHLELYREVDIALDTFPFNGATTTCEALWMGVPVITRSGRTHTSRMGASLLGAIGRADWVAASDDAFVAAASHLAADPGALAAWRRTARDTLRASPLFDHPGFTRTFEALIVEAWERRVGAS